MEHMVEAIPDSDDQTLQNFLTRSSDGLSLGDESCGE
jgi:hypothetical protein